VHASVASTAKRNQVQLGELSAGVAAEFLVMDFQIRHRAAGLTAPAVTMQNLLP
jgi:hypothetical protein